MNEAKKIVAVLMLLAICLTLLPSCGKADIRLDGKTFAFSHARIKSEVISCSHALAETYKEARTEEYTLKAEGGKLTLEGEGGVYTGEYKVNKLFDDSVLYEINIGSEPGFAALSERRYEDGTSEYTLILTIYGYSATFTAEKTAEEAE